MFLQCLTKYTEVQCITNETIHQDANCQYSTIASEIPMLKKHPYWKIKANIQK